MPTLGPSLHFACSRVQLWGIRARKHSSQYKGWGRLVPSRLLGSQIREGDGMRWQSSLGFVPVSLERRGYDSSRRLASPSGYHSRAALPILFLYLCSQGRLFLFACNQATDGKLDSAIVLLLEKPCRGKRQRILQCFSC